MDNPFKTGEFIPDSLPKPKGGCALFLFILGALGGVAYYGVTGFLERI